MGPARSRNVVIEFPSYADALACWNSDLYQAAKASNDVKRADAEVKRSEASVLTSDSLVYQAEANGLSAVATTRNP